MADSVIHKYTLQDPWVKNETIIQVPRGSRPLGIAEQRGSIVLWVLKPLGTFPDRNHYVVSRTTGEHFNLGKSDTYIGTMLFDGGDFVAHYFWSP